MDPVRAAVNDELSSAFSALKRNAPGGTAIGRQMDIEGARLLTPNLGVPALQARQLEWANIIRLDSHRILSPVD
jgi:hypothetical protein